MTEATHRITAVGRVVADPDLEAVDDDILAVEQPHPADRPCILQTQTVWLREWCAADADQSAPGPSTTCTELYWAA